MEPAEVNANYLERYLADGRYRDRDAKAEFNGGNIIEPLKIDGVCDEPFPWTVEELEREHQNRDVGDSVRRLAEAGLVYRVRVEVGGRLGQGRGVEPPLHQEFVLPTRAGRKADEIEVGSG
ncbi:MAG TPA: hypothetical protein VGG98_09490 [Solirubrobacteraceae bacterium]|jgi:hypothetical protein